MPTTLSSTPQESTVSGRYVFRGVQYNITVATTNQQVSVSVFGKWLGDRWSYSFDFQGTTKLVK